MSDNQQPTPPPGKSAAAAAASGVAALKSSMVPMTKAQKNAAKEVSERLALAARRRAYVQAEELVLGAKGSLARQRERARRGIDVAAPEWSSQYEDMIDRAQGIQQSKEGGSQPVELPDSALMALPDAPPAEVAAIKAAAAAEASDDGDSVVDPPA